MTLYFYSILFFSIYLIIINYYLRKYDICLDKVAEGDFHKSLLRSNNFTPVSGTFYFLPIILILFFWLEIEIIIVCLSFFVLGLLSDLKILNSYKLRLFFQIFFLIILLFINKDLEIYTRLDFLDNLMEFNYLRILISTFFFLVLINGYNLIDGTNSLCSLNFLVISIFIYLMINKMNLDFIEEKFAIFIILIFVFFLFNFFGLNFLGDGAAYGLGFFLGYFLVNISLINQSISPYFIANLLWYPAFENLFSIVRRTTKNANNYLPDNKHLHHLMYKYLKKKNTFKKNFILSTSVGLIINLILIINYSIGYNYITNTPVQCLLILFNIFLYMLVYYNLAKKIK
jgi:UDP-N-acetylmuramyl pentapeptide phosphotransferase/UDP-N-acetylglucosamine-1-phosphate transferase